MIARRIANEAVQQLYHQRYPLLDDPQLMDEIERLMFATIQQVVRNNASVDVREVLNQAFYQLLCHPRPESWEALGVVIAKRRAIDALRRSLGASGSEDRPDRPNRRGLYSVPVGDGLDVERAERGRQEGHDPVEDAMVMQQEIVHIRVARRILSERDCEIFFALHYLGARPSDLRQRFGLTPTRIRQIYREAATRVLNEARRGPDYPSDYFDED